MQNSRIFLVFLLSFLSFFLSFVFFLKAGRGGGEVMNVKRSQTSMDYC